MRSKPRGFTANGEPALGMWRTHSPYASTNETLQGLAHSMSCKGRVRDVKWYLSYKMVDVSHRVDSELGRDPFQLLWA
jgi:hypothetical protein